MPVKMSKQFIDVNFEQAVPSGQALGLIWEPPQEMFARAPAEPFSSYTALIPRSEWSERAKLINPKLRQFVRNRKNQRSEGSCVFNSSNWQYQFAFAQQFGWDTDYKIMSAIIGYAIYGNSPGSGAYVGDSIKFHLETGTIPEAGHGYPDKHQFAPTGFHQARAYMNANPDWKETAKNYMSLEYYRVDTVEEWATALLLGHPITKGRNGHCICDFIWEQDEQGKWFAGYCNSWEDWGDPINDVIKDGLGYDSERSIGQQSGYALVGVKMRPELARSIPQPAIAT